MAFLILLWLGVLVLLIASWWKIFEKARQPGWAAIIPIYNYYIVTQIIGKPGWWVLMMFLPVVNIVFLIWAMNLLSKSFGKDEGFTVGLVLLAIVFVPILAFGDAQYKGNFQGPAIGTLDDPNFR